MNEKFNLLSLDKKTIVELTDQQLNQLRGGNGVEQSIQADDTTCRDGGITCVNASSSCQQKVS